MSEEILQRRLDREIKARKSAEEILELKALELYNANLALQKLNKQLEQDVEAKSTLLIKNELRYKSLVDDAKDSIFNFSKDLKLTYVNAQTEQLFGKTAEVLIGTNISELVRSDYLEHATKFFEHFWHEDKSESYIEMPLLHPLKSELWGGINLTYVEDSRGNYFNAIVRDISERKLIEQNLEKAVLNLEKSEHKYRGILMNMQLGILEQDNDGTIVEANEIYCSMLGYQLNELIGKHPNEFILHKDHRPLQDQKIFSEGSKSYPIYDVKLIKKTGDILNVLISLAPVYNLEGSKTGTIAIHFDITERHRLQERLREAKEVAEKARKAEQKFLAVMTHEIRTPLNAILGMSHLLNDTSLDTEQGEFVSLIKNAADMLQSLVSDVLDLSKIQAGKIDLKPEEFDLIFLLENCLKTIQIKNSDPKVSMQFEHDEYNDYWVKSDKKIIHQIVINLLGNAMKFTHEGTIKLQLKQNDFGQVELRVTDTGIGIEESKLKLVFKEFEQANEKIHGTYGGTGLGLSICQRLASLLGTKLNVSSVLGTGTIFSFVLPMKRLASGTHKEPANKSLHRAEELNILVAEDNVMNQKYISKLLDKKNVQYQIATNGQEAVDACKKETFNLIFMDLHMPVMDGYEATSVIRNSGKNIQTPIIALTASTMLSQKEHAFEVGMTGFLSKPFTPAQLFNVINGLEIEKQTAASDQSSQVDSAMKIDEALVRTYLGEDLEYQNEIFSLFMTTMKEEKPMIIDAFENQQLDLIASSLHKVKPMFQMVGLKEVYEAIRQAELEAREGKDSVINKKEILVNLMSKGEQLISKRLSS